MALENGMERTSVVRHHINIFQSRRDYLAVQLAERQAEGLATRLAEREMEAIDWAIPVLEAEWDSLARIHRTDQAIARRLEGAERRGEPDLNRPVVWATS